MLSCHGTDPWLLKYVVNSSRWYFALPDALWRLVGCKPVKIESFLHTPLVTV